MKLRARVLAIPALQSVSVLATYAVVSCVGTHAETNPVTRAALELLGPLFVPLWLSVHAAVALGINATYGFAERAGRLRRTAFRIADTGYAAALAVAALLAVNDLGYYLLFAGWCGLG
jgi:hypothetical protein